MQMNRHDVLTVISDLSKDAYGVRVRLDYESMTDEELYSTYDSFLRALDESISREKEEHERCLVEFEILLSKAQIHGAADRKTALRWVIEAEAAAGWETSGHRRQEAEHILWSHGLSYKYISELLLELEGN